MGRTTLEQAVYKDPMTAGFPDNITQVLSCFNVINMMSLDQIVKDDPFLEIYTWTCHVSAELNIRFLQTSSLWRPLGSGIRTGHWMVTHMEHSWIEVSDEQKGQNFIIDTRPPYQPHPIALDLTGPSPIYGTLYRPSSLLLDTKRIERTVRDIFPKVMLKMKEASDASVGMKNE